MRKAIIPALALTLTLCAQAAATPIHAKLTASNGEGSFNPTIGCPSGDGPSWKYGWAGASSPGPLGGTWSGIFEIHDAGQGAFVPASTSTISLNLASGGTASLHVAGGDCADAPLHLARGDGDDATASGVLPVVAGFGTGAARGLVGSGTAAVELALTAGADNPAIVDIIGDFDVRDPQLSVVGASSRWTRVVDLLNRRLTVSVVLANASGTPLPGNAYAVRVTGAATSPATAPSGLPAAVGTVPAGESRTATFVLNGARPATKYTMQVSAHASDGLGAAMGPVEGTVTFTSPLLFP